MSEYDPYSPQLRTALVLTGIGTAGAYHAGVLRALAEAGVKIDVVAGRGVGVVGALFAAIDGGQRLWEAKGFWRSPAVTGFYGWRTPVRAAGYALVLSIALVAAPLLAIALGLVVFPIDFVLKMLGAGGGGLVALYLGAASRAFAPDMLPTWLPRLVVIVLTAAAAIVIVDGWHRTRGRQHGRWWWRLAGAPLSAEPAVVHTWRVMWDLIRGAAHVKQPGRGDLGRRYLEMLNDSQGQPGFRELVIVDHDVDARRDLVFAFVGEARRRDLYRRSTEEQAAARRAEVFDLAGIGGEYLAGAVAAALTVPAATDSERITFAPDAYWRGETHRLIDRPSAVLRLLTELADLGVEQAIVVSAAPVAAEAHALAGARVEPRARLGELLQAAETAAVTDALRAIAPRIPRVFSIRPPHNPVGPLDFGGGYDDRSDRRQPLEELLNRGYEDAYHQFVEPVIGASGEAVGLTPRP